MSRRAGYVECAHEVCMRNARTTAIDSTEQHSCCGGHECEEAA